MAYSPSIKKIRREILQSGFRRTKLKNKSPTRLKARKTAVMYELEQKHGRPIEDILIEGDAQYIQNLLGIKQSTVYLWWDYFGIEPPRVRSKNGLRNRKRV